MAEQLRLLASDAEDLKVISALVQDAVFRAGDIGLDARARVLAMVGNRYRWEGARSRSRAGLRFGGVLKARQRNWPASDDTILSLLAIRAEGDTLLLDFAAGVSLRLDVECIDVTLEDLSGPWDTARTPAHDA